MSFIILFDPYHDNSALDEQVFATKESAAEYIQELKSFDAIPVSSGDIEAQIYEVGDTTLKLVETWYQTYELNRSEYRWTLNHDEVDEFWRQYREKQAQSRPVDDQSWGVTRYDGDGTN